VRPDDFGSEVESPNEEAGHFGMRSAALATRRTRGKDISSSRQEMPFQPAVPLE
jgi:hypothetical protein